MEHVRKRDAELYYDSLDPHILFCMKRILDQAPNYRLHIDELRTRVGEYMDENSELNERFHDSLCLAKCYGMITQREQIICLNNGYRPVPYVHTNLDTRTN